LHIERVAKKYGCQHLDFFSEVVDEDGTLRDELTWDGLHLNDDGYALFAQKLEPYLPPK
jgi:lysophospholipase L1-like esterase